MPDDYIATRLANIKKQQEEIKQFANISLAELICETIKAHPDVHIADLVHHFGIVSVETWDDGQPHGAYGTDVVLNNSISPEKLLETALKKVTRFNETGSWYR